ncbi:MAG: methyltransferase [Bryobacterales bacterium]|nr:methyltransferase [Acidobacteriota bacterium]MCB9383760.1 methyltransferase [Bryobacterales bacterium]
MYRLAPALLLTAALLPAQLSKEANAGYKTAEDRARVAQSLQSDEREQRQKPRELIASIGVKKGWTIADIGSGPGFMEPYFLEAIGPTGKIYAEDIQQDFLDQVKAKIKENGWKNVETILGGQTNPNLPKGKVDLAFILDAYHHFEQPQVTLGHIRESLKPGGQLAVVDFYRSRPHPTMSKERLEGHIREDRDGFAAEIEKAGFKLVRTFDHLPYQYVLLFEAK